MNYFLDNPIPTAAQLVQRFADGGEVGITDSMNRMGSPVGGEDKPLMQILYERGEISEAEYNDWLANQVEQTMGSSEEYNPVTPLPKTQAEEPVSPLNTFKISDALVPGASLGVESKPITPEMGASVLKAFADLKEGLPKYEPAFYGTNWGTSDASYGGAAGSQKRFADLGYIEEPFKPFSPAEEAQMQADYQAMMAQSAKTPEQMRTDLQAITAPTVTRELTDREKNLETLGNLLQSNNFEGAFAFAQQNDLMENVLNPDKMRYLRGPMNEAEMTEYFRALPNIAGKDELFIPEKGLESTLQTLGGRRGYANPYASLEAKPDKTVDLIAQLAMATVPGIGPLGAAALSGGAKYITSGGDLKAALTSAALAGAGNYVGGKIMDAVKAPSISDLTGVTTTASRAAQAAAETASNAIANGVAPELIQEVVISAARSAAPNLAAGVLNSITNGVLTNLISRGVQIPKEHLIETQAPEGQAPSSTTAQELGVSDPSNLEEVVVQSLRKAGMPDLSRAFASTVLQGGAQDILTERQIQEAQQAEQQRQEQDQQDLDEIVMQARRLQPVNIGQTLPALSSQIERFGPSKLVTETTPLEEVTMQARRPQQPNINLGSTLAGLAPSIAAPGTGEAPLEEVVSTARRPAKPEINLGQLATLPLSELFPRPNVDPFTGKIAPEQPKTQTELDKIEGALATGAVIPGTTSVLSKLASGAEKAANLAKAGSLVGTALSGLTGKGSSGTAGAGAGGAQYDPRTSAAAGQWIDWEKVKKEADAAGMNLNTYTARNWNKIQNRALEAGAPAAVEVAPEPSAGYNPDEVPMNAGGPVFMSDGNLVNGPGSGREDMIPALLSDGEYVIDAETMALLGDGSTKKAAQMMDNFRRNIRKHKGSRLAKGGISPDAKSPLQYLKG